MSFEGFSSDKGQLAVASGQKGPERDAWGNPLKTDDNSTQNNQTQNNQNNNNSNQNNDGNNNGGVNTDTIDDIWKDIKKPDQQQNNNNNQNNQNQNNNQQQPPDPAKQLKDYLTANGLGEFVVTDAEKAKMAEGDFGDFSNRILGLVQQAHVKAISSASALIDSKVAAALEKSGTQTRSILAGKENLGALNAALPFTKDPAIGPVAQTVMQRFFDRGATQEQAIVGVKKFFEHTAQQVTGNTVNANRNGNFQGGRNNDPGVDSWIDVLSPGR